MKKNKILIVEDEALVAFDIKNKLENRGYNVIGVFSSGEKALKSLSENTPDLILMDIMLDGELDGIDTAKKINEQFEDIPIIYLTAYSDEGTLSKSRKVAPFNYIFKPIDENLLFINIDMTLIKNKLEKKLQENEKFYNTLLKNIQDMVILLTKEGKIKYINKASEKVLGISIKEIYRKNIFEIIDEKDLEKFEKLFKNLVENKQIINEEVINVKTKDKSKKYIKIYGENLLDDDVLKGVILTCFDVTKQKEAEIISEKYKFIVNDSKELMTLVNSDYIYEAANDAYCFAHGKKREDIVGKHVKDIWGNYVFENAIKESLELAFSGKEVNVQKWLFFRGNKEERYFDITYYPHLVENRIPYVVVVCRDITEKKIANEKLLKTLQVIEQNPSLISITDTNGIIEYVNFKYFELLSCDPEKIIGKKLSEVKGKIINEHLFNTILEELRLGKEWSFEIYCKNEDKERWFQTFLFPIRNQSGDIINFVEVSEDITQKKILEKNIEIVEKSKEEIEKVKNQFLYNMKHELLTPMNGILGMLDLLFLTDLSKEQREYLEMIKVASSELMKIINNILNFSKIEAKNFSINKIEFNILDLVSEILDVYNKCIKERGLNLIIDIDKKIKKNLIGDYEKIKEIIINLVDNAIKFTEKGEIKILIECIKEINVYCEVKFTIIDTGIGIDEKDIKYLFKSFVQLDSSFTRKQGGTGLGLMISKKYVELMDGQIGVESKKGEGSRFYFTLPLEINFSKIENDYQEINKGKDDIMEENLKKRILIVEDDIINQRILGTFLEMKEYDVMIASDGRELFKILENQGKFDLILMDMELPYIDGFEAIPLIRKKEKENGIYTPIIVMTGYAEEDVLKDIEVDGFISKPIMNFEEVFSMMEKFLNKDEKEIEKKDIKEEIIIDDDTVFDTKYVKKIIGDNEELLKELIDYFLENTPKQLKLLEEHIENEDFEKVKIIAHTLKSNFANFGSSKGEKISSMIEELAKMNKLGCSIELLSELKDEFNKILKFINK